MVFSMSTQKLFSGFSSCKAAIVCDNPIIPFQMHISVDINDLKAIKNKLNLVLCKWQNRPKIVFYFYLAKNPVQIYQISYVYRSTGYKHMGNIFV